MTTVNAPNIHNIAIDGSFDDCQKIAKSLLAMPELQNIAAQHHATLSAVNSINWGRILAQIVYYVYAALKVGAPQKPVSFAVPSGNFGNIFAGFLAKSMGLPIHRLIIATNHNNILEQIQKTGNAPIQKVSPSLSPSMDIQVSSNFERLIFLLSNRDASQTKSIMNAQEQKLHLSLTPQIHNQIQKHFDAFSLDDEQTLQTINHYFHKHNLLVDPHSAVGLKAAERALAESPSHHVVALGTAHPAKFPETVSQATGQPPPQHPLLSSLSDLPESFSSLENNTQSVFNHIVQVVSSQ
jgi:threonine synthase